MRLRNIPGSRDIIAASDFVIQDPEAYKGRWKTVFGKDHPIELEIGIGKGRFLMDLAQKHPERNYLGIEMYSSVLLRAIQKAEQRTAGLAAPLPVSAEERPKRPEGCNFRLLRFDATELPYLFEQGEIEKIYLNFSDPWPKDRHADRRLTSACFLKRYEQVLQPGHGIAFKTDNRDLFDFSLDQLKESGWELTFCSFDLHGTGNRSQAEKDGTGSDTGRIAEGMSAPGSGQPESDLIMTEYEEKFAAEGHPICMLEARIRGH